MQQVAAWLVARPLHGILALAAASALPITNLVATVFLTMFVLYGGMRLALLQAAAASALVLVAAAIGGSALEVVLTLLVANWMPALMLAAILVSTRSLTLTVQLSVLIAAVAITAFMLVTGDPVAFWVREFTAFAELLRQAGQDQQAERLMAAVGVFTSDTPTSVDPRLIAMQITILLALAIWSLFVVTLLLGYLLYRQVPAETVDYGRFSDLNLGRVLAFGMALASVLALLLGAEWLQSVAFVVFACFWLQGLAVLHWLRRENLLPVFIVVGVYLLMLLPPLNAALLLVLAAMGYADAWFRFRRRRPVRTTGSNDD